MDDPKNEKVFRSGISVLMHGCILFLMLPAILPLFFLGGMIVPLCIVGGVIVFVSLLSCTICYVISDDTLLIKCFGISHGNVKIADIVAVERSYSIISSPAASLKRLEVRSGRGAQSSFVLISPVREHEFLEELKTINPQIVFNVPIREEKWRIWDWDV